MKLTVLGSGSSANGYVLQNETEAIVLECGCPFSACEKVVDYNISKIKGCFITHEHQDHAHYAKTYAQYLQIYSSYGTLEKLNLLDNRAFPIKEKQRYTLGGFTIIPFKTEHDAAEPLGFIVKHKDFGALMFATDTYYLRYYFSNLDYLLIECNYDREKLNNNIENGLIPKFVGKRILRSHLSLDDCIKTILANDLTKIKGIVLLHLSSNNGNEQKFKDAVVKATGKQVIIAKKGLEIELFT
jgi:phosphoribosyl 1,2-cyclic phosphodiesterase